MPPKPSKMWWLYALLSALFAAFTAILSKVGVRGIEPDLATAIRTAVVVLLVWSIVLVKGGEIQLSSISRWSLVALIASGITTGLSWIFYFRALQVGKVSQVAPVDKASLAITLLLSLIVLGEPLTWKVALGTVLILAGTLVVIV